MEWVMILILIFGLIHLDEKLNKMMKLIKVDSKNHSFDLKDYIGKKVFITIDNDEISNSYLFSSIFNKEITIIDFDKEWLVFEYEENKKKQRQYIRLSDITSINLRTKD